MEAHQINLNKYQNLNVWKYQKGCWTKVEKIFSRQAMRWLIMNKTYPIFAFLGFGGGGGGKIFGKGVLFPCMFLNLIHIFSKCAQYFSICSLCILSYSIWFVNYSLCYPQHSLANPMVVPNSSTFYSIFLAQNPTLVAYKQEPNLKGQ